MLDIDNFKQVNDTYGHLQGDLVLREVARVLRQSSREIDEPARYGGEEMAVALPQTDLEGAYQFAERVRHAVEGLELPLPTGDGHAEGHGLVRRGLAGRPPTTPTRTRWWPPPTARCTRPSARARTGRCGRTGRCRPTGRRSRRRVRGVACWAEAWDCSTTQSASTSSSSAGTGPIPTRSRDRRTRRSAPLAAPSSPQARGAPEAGGDEAAAERSRAEAEDDEPAAEAPAGARRGPEPPPSRASRAARARAGRAAREPFDVEAVEPAAAAAEPATERRRPWLEDEPDEVPAEEALDHPRTAEEQGRRGRPGGDAGLPPGDARARPPVVRAAPAARLRLGQVAPRTPVRSRRIVLQTAR